jgi:DNA-binding transcriptional ArsR family regulator
MHANLNIVLPSEEQIEVAAGTFQMLSDPTRIRLLSALAQGEQSVTCLAEIIGAQTAAVSQHLTKLRLAGIVRQRREGNFMFYTLNDVHACQLLQEALKHADHLARNLPDHEPTPENRGEKDHVLQHN